MTLRDIVIAGDGTAQHPDLLTVWLPNHCLLGASLRDGFIPTWNPYSMAGAPFAADPQSGWMNLLAMTLYGSASCATALRLYIAVQPILAGCCVYGFLRSERVPRAAALAGGLLLSGAVGSSRLAVALAFSGAVAWVAALLFALSRSLRSGGLRARFGWTLGACLAGGQLAGVHGTHGLLVGAGVALVYLAGAAGVSRRRKVQVLLRIVTLGPLVNAALVLPRIAYVGRSSLGAGYDGPDEGGLSTGAGLELADLIDVLSPGWLVVGAGVCALAVAGATMTPRAARMRGFGIAATVFALSSLDVTADVVDATGLSLPFLNLYLHDPSRLALGYLVIVAVLAAQGAAVAQRAVSGRSPGSGRVAAAATCALLLSFATVALQDRRPAAAAGVVNESRFGPRYAAPVSLPSYMDAGRIARAIARGGAGRFITLDRRVVSSRAYLDRQRPIDWPALANQRGTLLGIEDAQTVTQPVQPHRYWTYMRATGAEAQKYNASFFEALDPKAAYLLDVAYVVSPHSLLPRVLAVEGGWEVTRTFADAPRVELRHEWTTASSPREALAMVTSDAFDPWDQLVVEHDEPPPDCRRAPPSTVDVLEQRAGLVVARTWSRCDGMLLVHNTYDPGWTVSIDGRPGEIMPGDYLLQAIPVEQGRHVLRLVYRDRAVSGGLAVSAATFLLLALRALRRRRRSLRAARLRAWTSTLQPPP